MVRKMVIPYYIVCIYVPSCIGNIYKCRKTISLQITSYLCSDPLILIMRFVTSLYFLISNNHNLYEILK